ncbi:hypothetical protein SORDD27_01401 [Streptococcus oralis]|uniref:Uncharacterized protein n=1 Tax=Streptococcus oralis TaxID=1303 RepID=A0A139PVV5_STROR|nr:hypothetical protein SORDD27_01401 [Streptococcus oralis]
MHILDRLWPIQLIQVVKQALCIGRNFEHPLTHRFADNWIASTLRRSVRKDFFVCDSCSQLFNPVYRHFGFIGQAFFVKLSENPLRPLIVVWICCVNLTIPVIREAKRIDLTFEVGNVFRCEFCWVIPCIHGVLLCRQTKSIPTHWVKDIVTLGTFVTAKDISRCITFWVSYVQTCSRRVREHVKRIKLRF